MAWLLSAALTFNHKYILTATYGIRDNYMTKKLAIDSAANAVKSQTANFSNMRRFDLLFSAPFSCRHLEYAIVGRCKPFALSLFRGRRCCHCFPVGANAQVQQQLSCRAALGLNWPHLYIPELWVSEK